MDTLKRMPVDASHYTYRVTWSAEDGEFVATCLELLLPYDTLAMNANSSIDTT